MNVKAPLSKTPAGSSVCFARPQKVKVRPGISNIYKIIILCHCPPAFCKARRCFYHKNIAPAKINRNRSKRSAQGICVERGSCTIFRRYNFFLHVFYFYRNSVIFAVFVVDFITVFVFRMRNMPCVICLKRPVKVRI